MPRRRKYQMGISGLLVVDKPLGASSMDVVRWVRRAGGGVKVGHAGTLDPLATGVVICCLGQATRYVEMLMGLTKVYDAEIDFSCFTTTDDREGEQQPVAIAIPPDELALKSALTHFVGCIKQRPPAYSAVHVDGKRAYRLARRGINVELPLRTVQVDQVQLLGFAWPLASVRITCGRGTYVRSIARDLGTRLGTGGHLRALRRTAVGPYNLDQAVSADRLREPISQEDLLPVPDRDAVDDLCS